MRCCLLDTDQRCVRYLPASREYNIENLTFDQRTPFCFLSRIEVKPTLIGRAECSVLEDTSSSSQPVLSLALIIKGEFRGGLRSCGFVMLLNLGQSLMSIYRASGGIIQSVQSD